MAGTKKPSQSRQVSGPGKPIVAVIGYGSQGRAISLNLQDSGYEVIVGLRGGSKSYVRARREGIRNIATIPAAVRKADCICFAFPDHVHGKVYKRSIRSNLKKRTTMWFLHGLSVHFGLVTPPETADVILIAPHAPGLAVREKYLGARDISGFYAIHQDRLRRARTLTFRLAEGIGISRTRLLKTTFGDEAVGDMFGEQSVLCGGLAMLVKLGFDTLVGRGHKPEHAYLEVAYQLDLIVDLIKRHGIDGMFSRISVAARFGSLTAGPKILDDTVRRRMEEVYDEIDNGDFARKLKNLSDKDLAALASALRKLSTGSLNVAARKFSK
jgi:ketol-acid reductoisomerase